MAALSAQQITEACALTHTSHNTKDVSGC